MRSGSDQRSRGRYTGSTPFQQQQRTPQRNPTFDSSGPSIKIRGSAYQIFERYVALAREAAIGGDPIAAENLYQHAEHYFRVHNADREGRPLEASRPLKPADVSTAGPEQGSREADMRRSQPGCEDDRPGFV
jgi:hypothetical protein